MTEKDIKALMEKYLNGTITKREESLLEQFDCKLILKNEEKLFNREKDRSTVDYNLYNQINNKRKRPNIIVLARIAASVVVLLGLGFLFFTIFPNEKTKALPIDIIVVKTEWGQKMNLMLSDGTQVHLNSGTTLKFPEKFNDSKRSVELYGEAFFDVAKNPKKPFIIKTEEINTTVLGTSFNINNYENKDQIAVTVATGKVKVSTDDEEVSLKPNSQGVFDKTTKNISKEKVNTADFLYWKDGIIHFEDTPLKDVFEVLEHWYGVTFVFENKKIKQCHLTATYDNEILTVVLESMVYVKKGLQFKYLEDKKILIKGICSD